MSLNWLQLRTWDGSQHKAFEELCCQLAHAESVPAGSAFRRKGARDAGVECFWTSPSGAEAGWQAKFFASLGDTQWEQLDDSVKTALEKHPRLTRYIVCVPLDRADPRIVKKGRAQKSAMSAWDDHVRTWSQWAAERNMTVSFEYWGDHEIAARLALDAHHGRHYFWFHEEQFGPAWFEQRFEEARANAGERYTPELNVDLPVARLFDGLGRTEAFRLRFLTLRGRMRKESQWFERNRSAEDEGRYGAIAANVREVIERLDVFDDADHLAPYDFVALEKRANETADAAYQCGYALEAKAREEKQRDAYSYERRQLYDLGRLLHDVAEESTTSAAKAANTHAALLDGEAGNGKTHLMCDVAERRLNAKLPTVLLLGEQFTKAEPWTQILQLLHVGCRRDEFLGALDAAAEAQRSRALILIDALNEGEDRTIWKRNLAGFLKTCARYPRISIALSVRTSYIADVVPESVSAIELARETHRGFAAHEYRATRTFFDWFGIKRPSVPLLNPEFENPLFLKLFCKGVKDAGLTETPKGVHGITRMFGFLLDAVNHKVSGPDQLDFDPARRLVHDALRSVAERLATAGAHFLPRADAQVAVDAHLPNRPFGKSLFARLLSEGLLTEERIWTREGIREGIRFSYERLQDHQIATYLLETHIEGDDIAAAFAPEEPLGARVRTPSREWSSGLIDALAIQVPERFGVELADVLPDMADSDAVRHAFIRSLLWRRADAISEPAKTYLDEHIQGEDFDEMTDALLTVAANPDHPFNADFLHVRLLRDSMAERDAWWSIYLAGQYEAQGAVDRLVEWAWSPEEKHHIDAESIRLAATALLWFHTTSHRPLRDRASKALVRLLTPRLGVLEGLLATFKSVDDLYVRERLYAVAYGCVLRSTDDAGITRVAQRVYDDVFKAGVPTPHLLLRDYARGVVEYALHRDLPVRATTKRIRPPHRSEWPTIFPTEEEVAKYGKFQKGMPDEELALLEIHESVAGSGDFARYVIGTNSHTFDWSPTPLRSGKLLSKKQQYVRFEKNLTARQRTAFRALRSARTAARVLDAVKHLPETIREKALMIRRPDVAAAEKRFVRTLGQAKRRIFEDIVRPRLDTGENKEDLFDLGLAQRWIFQRVLDLGWTPERFGYFDRNYRREMDRREASKPERIGKKYQWLAWHEFLARVADNFRFGGRFDAPGKERYDGPWQIGERDLDPSLLIASTQENAHTNAWWFQSQYTNWDEPQDTREWVRSTADLPDPRSVIAVTRPDGTPALVLEMLCKWEESSPPGEDKWDRQHREMYYWIKSYFVRREHTDTLFAWAREQTFWGRWMPEVSDLLQVFLGEFYWSPAYAHFQIPYHGVDGWTKGAKIPHPVLVSAEGYLWESTSFDCSIDSSINLLLPAKWFVDALRLESMGHEAAYFDPSGRLVADDPSVREAGPSALVVNRVDLQRALDAAGYDIIWTLMGEREAPSPNRSDGAHIYPLILTGCYRLRHGELEGVIRSVRSPGDREDEPPRDTPEPLKV
ncbi:MAG: AVAST type 2 anti-phage system protein Avs2 [Thermoanaerobaculia bacterium]